MNGFIKALAVGIFSVATIGISAASAKDDRRSGDKRTNGKSNVAVSITLGSGQNAYNGNKNYNNGYRSSGNRVVNRRVIGTRYRARIIVEEKIVRNRRGANLICTVSTRGKGSANISYKRLKRVANNNCSRRARVKIYA